MNRPDVTQPSLASSENFNASITLQAMRAAAYAVVVAAGLSVAAPRVAIAQNAPEVVPDVENSKYQFSGVVNSSAFLRSGPSDNDYPTQKVDKGETVTVVGIRYDWLKIAPPEGSFCYVAKAYVEKRGDGKIGRATQLLNVRVGSSLNTMKNKLALKLEPNTDVTIIGEAEEYFKIKPPEGVFYYVNKQFVDPVRPLTPPVADVLPVTPEVPTPPIKPTENKTAEKLTESGMPLNPDAPFQPEPAVESASAKPPGSSSTEGTDTRTNPPPLVKNTVDSPATRPSDVAAAFAKPDDELFEYLERLYDDATAKPLDQQPLDDLFNGYTRLANSDKLPESLRRISDQKAKAIGVRVEAQARFAEIKIEQDAMKSRQTIRQAEHEEIVERIKTQGAITFYAAVGTLRQSSLQQGTAPLYRLTDPSTGRTIVYLRSDNAKIADFLGQFIGVTGDVVSDAQLNLKVITPTKFEITSADKVFKSVAAQIVPPSLIPGSNIANTAAEPANP